jgi:transcription-repair coupling factor (superfamily II helicase)
MQHVATFRKRFSPLGIEVGSLSRATSAPETRETKEGLRRGKLKVVVGTQALASKDVRFADLGLVIIDEEQHFGAAEKAKLSGLAKGVHTLWMSATPIPRARLRQAFRASGISALSQRRRFTGCRSSPRSPRYRTLPLSLHCCASRGVTDRAS